jgi:hypothetical protein
LLAACPAHSRPLTDQEGWATLNTVVPALFACPPLEEGIMPKFCSLVLLLLFVGALNADELKTINGKTITGTLATISDSDVTLKTDAGTVATPLTQALLLDLRPVRDLPSGTTYISVQLLDDTVLRCKNITFQAKDAELTLLSGVVVRVPVTSLTAVLRDAQDPNLAGQWEKIARQKVRTDRIVVLRDGDLNPLEGTLGDIDAAAQTIQFKREGAAAVSLPFNRLQGMIFHRTDILADSPLCRVIDQDGSSLVAAKLGYGGTNLIVTTTFGARVEMRADQLAKLDFNFGKLTYLSDLDAKITLSPWLGGVNSFRRDMNLDGNEITLQDRRYVKGLSMYAGTELEYPLASKFKEFKATLGADTRIAEEGQGEVIVTIYCDGEKRFSEALSTRAARPIAINVKDVNTLRIVTAGRDFTNLSGHATLADARVSQ